MGYLTEYSLDYEVREPFPLTINEKFVLECKEKGVEIPDEFDVGLTGENLLLEAVVSEDYKLRVEHLVNSNCDCMRWYNHDDDMLRLSKEFPNVLFQLRGDGEESGDIWRKYYLDGKTYIDKVEMKFPDFDESKLR